MKFSLILLAVLICFAFTIATPAPPLNDEYFVIDSNGNFVTKVIFRDNPIPLDDIFYSYSGHSGTYEPTGEDSYEATYSSEGDPYYHTFEIFWSGDVDWGWICGPNNPWKPGEYVRLVRVMEDD